MRIYEPGRRPPSMSQIEPSVQPDHSQNEPPRWDLWLYGAGFVTVILIAASILSPWVRHEWALSVVRQNAPYTQLSFNSAVALPTTEVRGKGIPVSFAITNDEGKQISYQYVVASGSDAKLETLGSASKVVAAGTSWNVNITILPKCAASACRVQVSLPQQGESIDFIFTYQAKVGSSSKKSKLPTAKDTPLKMARIMMRI